MTTVIESNPNNCETCEHKKHTHDGHCYMFKNEPTEICYVHTARNVCRDIYSDPLFKEVLSSLILGINASNNSRHPGGN